MLIFSTLTLEITATSKTPYGYYYTPTDIASSVRSDHTQALRRPGASDADDDGSHHDVKSVPVGRNRQQLPDDPTLLATVIPWGTIQWLFFKAHLYRSETEYLLVGDESVVTKIGKTTYGLDRFSSSIFGRPVSGLAFLAFLLVSIKERKSYPLLVEQVVRSDEEKARIRQEKAAKAAGKGTGAKKKKSRAGLKAAPIRVSVRLAGTKSCIG